MVSKRPVVALVTGPLTVIAGGETGLGVGR